MKPHNWKTTRKLLQLAADLFPMTEKQEPLFRNYEENLTQNELELALDCLEELLAESKDLSNNYFIWNYLRTACESMRMNNREQFYRSIITENLKKELPVFQIDQPDIIGDVYYLSWFEKGRIGPISSGYRAQFKYSDEGDWGAHQQLIDKDLCFPGESAKIKFKFYAVEHVHIGKFYQNQEFIIREGSVVVAKGKIVEIPRIEYRK
jgi:hypothetical protein